MTKGGTSIIATINHLQLKEGDKVKVTINTFQGELTILEGIVKYKDDDISTYGAGWGIEDKSGKFTFLSCIARNNTKLVKFEEV